MARENPAPDDLRYSELFYGFDEDCDHDSPVLFFLRLLVTMIGITLLVACYWIYEYLRAQRRRPITLVGSSSEEVTEHFISSVNVESSQRKLVDWESSRLESERLSDVDPTERWEYITHEKIDEEEGEEKAYIDECDSGVKGDQGESDRLAASAQSKVKSTPSASLLSSLDRLADVSVFRVLSGKSSSGTSVGTTITESYQYSTSGGKQKYKVEAAGTPWKHSDDLTDTSLSRVETGEPNKPKEAPEKPHLLQTEAQKSWTVENGDAETGSEIPAKLDVSQSAGVTQDSDDGFKREGLRSTAFSVLLPDKSGLIDGEDSPGGEYATYSYRLPKERSVKLDSDAAPGIVSEEQPSQSSSFTGNLLDWNSRHIPSKSTSSSTEQKLAKQSGQADGYAKGDEHEAITIGDGVPSFSRVVGSDDGVKKSAQHASTADKDLWFSSFHRKGNEVESGLSTALANVLLNREAHGSHPCREELFSRFEFSKEATSRPEPTEAVVDSTSEYEADKDNVDNSEVANELMKQIDLIQQDLRDSMPPMGPADEGGIGEDASKARSPSKGMAQAGATAGNSREGASGLTVGTDTLANGQNSPTATEDTKHFASRPPMGTYYEPVDLGLVIANDGTGTYATSGGLHDDSLGLAFNNLAPASLRKDAQRFDDFPMLDEESNRMSTSGVRASTLSGEKESCNGAIDVKSGFSRFGQPHPDSEGSSRETELNANARAFAGTSSAVPPFGTASNHALLSLLEPGLVDEEGGKLFAYTSQKAPSAQSKEDETIAQRFAESDHGSMGRIPSSFDEETDAPRLRTVWPSELGSHEADAYISELRGVPSEEERLKRKGLLIDNDLFDELARGGEKVNQSSPIDTTEQGTTEALKKESPRLSQRPAMGREHKIHDDAIKKTDKEGLQSNNLDDVHMTARDGKTSTEQRPEEGLVSVLNAENEDTLSPGNLDTKRGATIPEWSHVGLMEPDDSNRATSADTAMSEAEALRKKAFDGTEGAIAAAMIASGSTGTPTGVSVVEKGTRVSMKKPVAAQVDFVDGTSFGEQADNEVSVFVTAGYTSGRDSGASFPPPGPDKPVKKQTEVGHTEQGDGVGNQWIDLGSGGNFASAQTEKWIPQGVSGHAVSSFGYATTSELYTVSDVETFVTHDFVYKQPSEGTNVLRYTDDRLVDTSASKALGLQSHSVTFEIQKKESTSSGGDSDVVNFNIPDKLVESSGAPAEYPAMRERGQTSSLEDRESAEVSELAVPTEDGRVPSFVASNNESDISVEQETRKGKRAKRNRRGHKTKQENVSSANADLGIESVPKILTQVKGEPKGQFVKENTTAVSQVTLVRSEAVQSVEVHLSQSPKAPSISSSFSSDVSPLVLTPSSGAQEAIRNHPQTASSTSPGSATSAAYRSESDQLPTDSSSQFSHDFLRTESKDKPSESSDEYVIPSKDEAVETTFRSPQVAATNRGRGVAMRKAMSVDVGSRSSRSSSRSGLMRSSILEVLGAEDVHHAISQLATLDEVSNVMRRAGLESSNLIFGIDYTASNKYQGENTFGGKSLHAIGPEICNPYQQVIKILGKTLQPFSSSGFIAAYGFGDVKTSDLSVFPLNKQGRCRTFEEVLDVYNKVTPGVILSGPTNFAPLIYESINICKEESSYHILVIVADGQVTNERETREAIMEACKYPLSIIVVGVGDGPWEMMRVFDESLPRREWDNFHFVDFHDVVSKADKPESAFALESLLEIPDQYTRIKALKLL